MRRIDWCAEWTLDAGDGVAAIRRRYHGLHRAGAAVGEWNSVNRRLGPYSTDTIGHSLDNLVRRETALELLRGEQDSHGVSLNGGRYDVPQFTQASGLASIGRLDPAFREYRKREPRR